jgi:hypothetical protein
MIYFASTRQSYEQLTSSSAWPPAALWTAAGVLNSTELSELRAKGISVTDFTNETSLVDAIDVIREHHPEQEVFVDGHSAG